MSRKWSRECWLRMWVANGSCEIRVANVGHEGKSRMGVAKWGHENKKNVGVCNWDPKGSNYLIIKMCMKK